MIQLGCLTEKKPKPGYKLVKSLFGKYEEIPEEWQLTKLSEITSDSISYGVLVPDSDPDGVPMIRSGELDVPGGIERNIIKISKKLEEKYKKTRLSGGELLVSLVGYTGQVTLASDSYKGYNVSRALGVIRLKKEFNKHFYYYALRSDSTQKKILNESIGSAQPVINLENLRKLSVIVPPFTEQQKIASILSNVDSLIESYNSIIAQTKKLRQGLMQRLLTKGIGHTKFKKTELGKIPEEWKISVLGEFAKIGTGGTPNRKNPDYYDGKIPWVKTTEVKYNIITKTEELITEKALEGSSTKVYPKNTLLFAMYGQGITRGRCAILGIDAAINQACAAIIPNESLNVWFLYYWIFFMYQKLRTLSTGTHQSNFNLDKVRKIIIIIPNQNEQQKIVSILNTIDSKITDLQTKKSSLEKLKKGLMQKLLTGQIRVSIS